MPRFSRKDIITRVKAIDKILARTYGPKRLRHKTDPTDELILTILSQNTNDKNRDQAYKELRRRFPTWRDVAAARSSAIASAIRIGGLSTMKSGRIKKILNQVAERSADMTLSFLEKMPDQEVWDYLTSFTGVGPKTASCVLLFALGRHAMPVDTHVFRVGKRLGLIPESLNVDRAHRWFLESNLPLNIYQLHINMIWHGRALCRPRNPRCTACPLKKYCLYYGKNAASRTFEIPQNRAVRGAKIRLT
jgi:endonuclease III